MCSKTNKTIWIINEYAGSPYHGMGMRHYFLAKELVNRGWDIYIITASYSHLLYKYPDFSDTFLEDIDGIKYVWIKVNKYTNAHSIGRVMKWLIFGIRLNFLDLNKLKISIPNFIIASCPELFHVIPAYRLSKKYGAKFIFEVRDIWPESLIELGGLSEKNILIKIMKKIENFAITKAEIIISLLPFYNKYLLEKGFNKSFYYLPNGFDFNSIDIEPLPSNIIVKIPKNKFIVGYTGTIGKANALEYLIDAAHKLRDYTDIVFLIVGKGMEEEKLKNKVRDLELDNVIFLPPVQKTQVQSILKFVDVCYIGLKKEKIFEFGVSPNKLFEYMYAEKPIIYAINSRSKLIEEANFGISVEAENSDAIADGVLTLYKMQGDKRLELGQNGKKYLMKYHTYEHLAGKLEEIFNNADNKS